MLDSLASATYRSQDGMAENLNSTIRLKELAPLAAKRWRFMEILGAHEAAAMSRGNLKLVAEETAFQSQRLTAGRSLQRLTILGKELAECRELGALPSIE